jgi:hypothetical protein
MTAREEYLDMGRITEGFIQDLEGKNIKYCVDAKKNVITLPMTQATLQWIVNVRIYEGRHWIIYRSVFPINCPKAKRIALCEFITRVNSSLVIGNFEMDFDDGMINYKTSADLEKSEAMDGFFLCLLGANFTSFSQYAPGITQLIYGDITPSEAVEICKSKELSTGLSSTESEVQDTPMAALDGEVSSKENMQEIQRKLAEARRKKRSESTPEITLETTNPEVFGTHPTGGAQ